MKIFKSLLLAVIAAVMIISCQKELKFDDSGVSAGVFKKDGTGNCLPVTVNGIYKVDSTLTAANFVDVQINASTPGTFEIKSDTINGYSFRKVGSVVFGANTIRLYASGKPVAAGTNIFTVKYGTSTCTFSITVAAQSTGTANFTLGGAPNACTGAIAGGTYIAGTALAPSNTLTIQVNVTVTGTYVIGAVTTNGFIFSGSGMFTSTGLQNVVLTGTGTPLNAGATAVNVTNISSACTFSVDVLPAGGGSPAVFTLTGTPGTCTGAVTAGSYTVGSSASLSNTVTVKVNVTSVGTYTITANTSNGLTFSKTGVFTTTGLQDVVLTASGTPTAAGTFNFTASGGGTNSCTFSVTCNAAVAVPAGDYFPLTQNSWWSYDLSFSGIPQADTSLNKATTIKTYNANSYREVEVALGGTPSDTLHYRKSGNDYFEWTYTDSYSGLFLFDNPTMADINFLKENAATGTTWSSPVFIGTVNSVSTNLRYDFKIESANTSLIVNGVTYNNVIQVSCTSKISVLGGAYISTDVNNLYYAKGVGLIKVKDVDAVNSSSIAEFDLRHYIVF
jgi:hypothetical protein